MYNAYFFLGIVSVIYGDNELQTEEDPITERSSQCRESHIAIGTNSSELYTLVDTTEMESLELQCHYCNEDDDQQSKVWYIQDRYFTQKPHEVNLGMHRNLTQNKMVVTPHHTLVIHNITINDTGIYYCHGVSGIDQEYKFNYLVDIVYKNLSPPMSGNLSQWKYYDELYLRPINHQLRTSNSSDLLMLRNNFNVSLVALTKWDPWKSCIVCGRRFGDGERHRVGRCHIKTTRHYGFNYTESNMSSYTTHINDSMIHGFVYSCHSVHFNDMFPEIGNITRWIPLFIQSEHCEGICNPDSQGKSAGWKTGKTKHFKYKRTFVLAQGAHLTIVCPESSLETKIIWMKDSKVIKPAHSFESKNFSEPRVAVDSFSTLYLQDVTSTEEGNYTCFVNDIRMQMNTVYVVSKAKLLTQAFLRHIIYLGFVLSLTISCYCAGLSIVWRRRDQFVPYSEIVQNPENL